MKTVVTAATLLSGVISLVPALEAGQTIEEKWAKSGTRREYLEWVNVWREQAHAARWSKLPKVLVIGDSIVGNYFDTVSKELKGVADCTRLNGSRVVGDPVLLQEFLLVDDERYAVIHVNNGLHGYDTTEEEYGRYLADYIDFIRAHQPQAKIVWGRSTQMMPAFCEYEKRKERLVERNRIADAIMAERGIPMTDLYSVTLGKPELYSPDGIHYNEKGSRALGLAAAASIKKALADEVKPFGMSSDEAAKWKLAFADEFDGASLDAAKWADCNPAFPGRPGSFVFARSNVSVKGGALTLTARELTDAEKASDLRGLADETWATGTVKSRARMRYGYFEARIRSMKANVCNAFWLYDPLSDDPAKKHAAGDESEEIDIVEMFGKPRDEGLVRTYCATLHRYLTPYCEAIVNKAKADVPDGSFRAKMPFDFWADYHVYGCKWTEDEIIWYVDGQKVFSRANDHWKRPLHVMLDCEVIAPWAGVPDAADLPATMSVDYVRVWTEAAGGKSAAH